MQSPVLFQLVTTICPFCLISFSIQHSKWTALRDQGFKGCIQITQRNKFSDISRPDYTTQNYPWNSLLGSYLPGSPVARGLLCSQSKLEGQEAHHSFSSSILPVISTPGFLSSLLL